LLSISTEASRMHQDALVVDCHNDLLLICSRHPPARQADHFREVWLPQLHAGGVDVQVLPVFVEPDHRPEGALRQTLRLVETAWRIGAGCPGEVAICLDGADVDRAVGSGRIALVIALEGCEAVGTDVGLFETLFRLGVRMVSFTHFGRTALADGSGEDATGSRLTGAGVEAVAACEELGIMLDVSHLSATGTDHMLELATRPLVASHSSMHALRAHHRNLTDERIRAIAAVGGVVGINVLAPFVDATDHTVARVADHIEHAAALVGAAHVGLGPDFFKEVWEAKTRPGDLAQGILEERSWVAGLGGPAGLPLITDELLRRGWSDVDLRTVLGGGFHDLFRRELGVPASHRLPAPTAAG
jgi:membrane dipeptidase